MTLRTDLALETGLCSILVEISKFKFFLVNHKNLRICYLRTGTPRKFADMQFVDC
jgi:hypothetical protein